MLTLTYGYKKPQSNDKGPIVFPAMEANIQQLNDHNHDGANSSKLPAKSIVGEEDTIDSASWVSVGNGLYRQLVTVLAGYDYDLTPMSFRLQNGDYVYPSVERVDSTQYYVYTNDNTQDYLVVYGG